MNLVEWILQILYPDDDETYTIGEHGVHLEPVGGHDTNPFDERGKNGTTV